MSNTTSSPSTKDVIPLGSHPHLLSALLPFTTLTMIPFLSLLLVPAVLAHNISPARRHSSLHPRDGSSRFTNYYAGENECAPPYSPHIGH